MAFPSASVLAEGDLDRWQLHEMAAEAVETGDRLLLEMEGAERTEPQAAIQETDEEPNLAVVLPKQQKPPAPSSSASSTPKPNPKPSWFSKRKKEPTIQSLREEAHALARQGLKYQFGSDDPKSGGMDCSATVQYLYTSLGIKGVPRTSYLQYEWLKKAGTLREVKGKNSTRQLLKRVRPGDLIFWGGTWKSGHKVSHVMVYLGRNPKTGEHFVFGARGKRVEGLLGSGVDVFVLNPDRGTLVGHGRVPGMLNS